MSRGRAFVRLRRRLRRPSLVGLAVASLVVHLGVAALLGWLGEAPWAPPPPATLAEPLIVELPPAEPGRPLVKPEAPTPPRPPAVAARPAPAPRPRPPAARPTPPAPAPEPAPPPPAPVTPPPPPAVAQAPEPPPEPVPAPPAAPPPPAPAPAAPPRPSAPELPPPPVVARGPEPAPTEPAEPAAPSPAPAPAAPPPPPIVARAPEPAVPAPAAPVAPAAPAPSPAPRAPEAAPSGPPAPAPSGPPAAPRASPPAPSGPPASRAPESAPGPFAPSPGESPLGGSRSFSLLRPPIEVPALPRVPGGGTRPEGDGAGEAGRQREGGPAIPLNKPPDEDYAEYFLKVKRAIEEKWSYPSEAARKGQSGQLVLEFVIRKDGQVSVEMTRSSGIAVLDRYAINAVRLASPYPALPIRLGEALRISANFSYLLDHGFRVFGLQ